MGDRRLSCALLSVSLFIAIQLFPNIFDRAENVMIDARYRLRSSMGLDPRLSDDIVLIAIDDHTHSVSGLDELPLDSYLALFKELGTMAPRQAAIDIYIKDKVGCEQDQRRRIIDEQFLFVSPYVARMDPGSTTPIDEKFNSFIWDGIGIDRYPKLAGTTLPRISDIVSYNDGIFYGYTNIISDPDGSYRRFPIVADLNGRAVPHLILQMILEGSQFDIATGMRLEGQSIVLKGFRAGDDLVIPLDSEGLMQANLMSHDSYKSQSADMKNVYMSANDILESRGSNTSLATKLAIVGDVSISGKDLVGTPLGLLHGPVLYHIVANSVLNDDFITHSSLIYDLVVLFLISIFLASIAVESSIYRLALSGAVAIIGYGALSFALFAYMSYAVSIVSVLLPSTILFIVLLAGHVYSSQVRMGVLEGSLSSYLSPNLMNKVKEDPDILKLGGRRKKISVLFSDIVGFTSFCDSVDSAEVQEVLEDYFSKMTRAIFDSNGIVDKYLGDGILAFFENERGSVSSPLDAMRAALAMQEGAKELDSLYKGMNRPPFEIRIGIATGYAKVGNIGPPEKVDYTVIGSVVNKASRLEGKAGAGGIAVDEDTYVFVKDDYSFEKIEDQELKGFSENNNIYVL